MTYFSGLNQWKNDPEAANAICRELIARRPDLPEAWTTLGVTQLRMQNDYLEAEKSAQEAMKLNPNQLYGPGVLAAVLAKTHPNNAVVFAQNQMRGDSVLFDLPISLTDALLTLRRLKEAEGWIEKMEGQGIDFEIQSKKGHLRLLEGRLTEAETELRKSLDMVGDNPRVEKILLLVFLGEVKYRQQKPREAEEFYKKAMELPFLWDQNCVKNEAHFLYGRFLAHQNRPAEAELQFEYALKISPKTWHYPLGMALLAAKNGRNNAALDSLEKALDRYYFDEVAIQEEPLFLKIRQTKRFRELMAKHFPENTTRH